MFGQAGSPAIAAGFTLADVQIIEPDHGSVGAGSGRSQPRLFAAGCRQAVFIGTAGDN
jgi:hypothetical protein